MSAGRPPGIREIAQRVGVSVATVSRVLNNKPDVSLATRNRVLHALEEVGYQLNRAAVSLSTGRTSLIALVLGEFTAFSETVEIARAVAMSAAEADYGTVLWLSELDSTKEAHYADLLAAGSVDGAIVAAVREEVPLLERLGNRGALPLVLIEPKDAIPGLPAVRTDHRVAGEAAVDHLVELGHKRIAIITVSERWAMGERHLSGYRAALTRAAVEPDESLIVTHLWWDEMGYEAGRHWGVQLLAASDPPTAIICCGDNVALGVMDAARTKGLEIPADLSVVGFDDIPGLASIPPGLTTIRRRASRLGEEAARVLFRLLSGEEDLPNEIILPTELEIRGSSAPPASR